jgi:hypothetical protein
MRAILTAPLKQTTMETGKRVSFKVGKSPIIEDNVLIVSIEQDDIQSPTFVYERMNGERRTAFLNNIKLINHGN